MIHTGDCLELLPTFAADSIDAIVTDPPYGLGFMGNAWDHAVPGVDYWREMLRVAKPGAHLLAFGGSRTYHRMACAIEDAGWEIRDCIMWLYGSGFPKSKNLGGDWQGWGTALKPAHEPIVLARKPLAGSVATNVQQFGTGALNIDGCRVADEVRTAAFSSFAPCAGNQLGAAGTAEARRGTQGDPKTYVGRWPANVIHDGSDEVAAAFPDVPGQQGDLRQQDHAVPQGNAFGQYGPKRAHAARGDAGTAARFFYCAKASSKERHDGLDDPGPQFKKGSTLRDAENLGSGRGGNHHPTVKPTDLMRYLCRLVTPPGGVVLDPFMGSGSTGRAAIAEGFRFVGIELSSEYAQIAEACIRSVQPGLPFGEVA